tara:strand:+ start:1434 stop:2120 length:687 start_codon:yes stop_codon:yes gene_type:complete
MNNVLKSLFLISLISFSSATLFSQNDSTNIKKINSEIGTEKGNYQLKAVSATKKVNPVSNFNLKINEKLNTAAIAKNIKENKSSSQTQNFLMEELPEEKDIIGKRYWKGKDVTHQKLRSDLSLGTLTSKTEMVKIECRDYSYVDGDRIRIYLNDNIISNNIGLKANYYVYYVNLKKGYNKIDFEALNQGSSGPNTAELKVYDANGILLTSKGWGLMTKQIATIGINYY